MHRSGADNAAVRDFELPVNLARAAAEANDTGSPRLAWLTALPEIVGELARRWTLDLGPPFQPGGVASWVAPATDASGAHLVLKAGWRHGEALHEADGLLAWDGHGAVRLVDSLVVEDTSALLLEACEPGTALSEALPPPEQDVVVARLLRRLWIDPPPDHPFRTLHNMCGWWADEFDHKYVTAPDALRVDPGIARHGMELFRGLPGTAARSVLLCTDLHHGNVLAAQREPWLMIDPKPHVGDPTYDPVQHVLNFPDRLRADPIGLADRMSLLLDLDRVRVRQWLFARCVQESVDQPYLHRVATALAP